MDTPTDHARDAYYDKCYINMLEFCDEQVEYIALMTDDDDVKTEVAFRILRERGL